MTNGIELETDSTQGMEHDPVPLAAFPVATVSVWTALMLDLGTVA